MKVLIIGDGNYDIYEKALSQGFEQNGWNVIRYSYGEYFKSKRKILNFYLKIEDKFKIGIINKLINYKLIKIIKTEKPDLVFLYRTAHIDYKNLKRYKKKEKFKIHIYNNDDPFSKKYKKYVWRKYFKLLEISDVIFSYREKNILDYKNIGYKNIKVLLPYYWEEQNKNLSLKKEIDILFIGHYENDGRDEYIKLLMINNFNFKIYGTGWEKSKYYDEIIEKNGPIKGIYGLEYNTIINKSKISLVFLSKINNDQYTRRNFEIPMAKSLVLSEYTEELSKILFKEGESIVCFKNKKEFLEKIEFYLKNDKDRQIIVENAYQEVKKMHSNYIRAKQIIDEYN